MSKLTSWKPLARGPVVTGPFETTPQDLGLQDQTEDETDSSSPQGRIKRVAVKTADLGKSLSRRARSPNSPSNQGHGRGLSLSRKGKGKLTEKGQTEGSLNVEISPSTPAPDDSPFIRPPSPSLPSSRPSLQSFRGAGSMRAGTQTLIQALQALPWTDDPDNEDISNIHIPQADTDSDEDPSDDHMASSIHAIYRPVARSRRTELPISGPGGKALPSPVERPEGSDADFDGSAPSEDDVDAEDFEAMTPRPPDAQRPDYGLSEPASQPPSTYRPGMFSRRRAASRAGSMTTVKIQRRTRLAQKLKEIYEIDAISEVMAEMPCWLLRSVLLQGYMYLTNSHLCFFAHMPNREDQVLKSGTLSKKATRTKRWTKYWFVLKNDALSWYQSSSDPYFLNGIMDLRYAISCDPSGDKEIRLRTNQKSMVLSADSVPSREEWVKAIRKVIFKAQNMGDTVKIAIPYSAILDVEKSSALDFSETIEIKVFDKEEHLSVDSYFFAYFHELQAALEQIRDAVRTCRTLPPRSSPQALLDTTAARPSHSAPHVIDRARSLPTPDSRFGSGFRLTSLLRPFQDSLPLGRMNSAPAPPERSDEFTHISKSGNASFVPVTSSSPDRVSSPDSQKTTQPSAKGNSTSAPIDHTYPPSTSVGELPPQNSARAIVSGAPWNVGVPSWLKVPRKGLSSSTSNATMSSAAPVSPSAGGVREVYSSSDVATHGEPLGGGQGDLGYSVLETAEAAVDTDTTEKFRNAFAFDDKEILLGYFSGYIFRLLPIYGRLYVSTNFFCFKSSGPLTSKTRMILPIRDILAVEKSKATRFGHHGLIVVIKGHEELFFEFGFEDRRTAFVTILERQMEDIRRRTNAGDQPVVSQGKRDALILEEFDPRRNSFSSDLDPTPASESMSDSLPAVMFTSASSTFLTFKPKESLHFTFLTIGSRGDVQPYIALGKGLMEDGHRVRIATHGEYQEWIESHGIEFGYVGGDPAELMRICIENGTFTVSFLKEGVQKFRGWLDDLLKTSFDACKGTDVLIESPSAMGGFHIAEALQIPYFRAFTMTWTRTRAYPHAFAVPEHKMGGGYNYMSYVVFDQVFWRATSGQINRWRRNVLHLENTSLDKMEPHKIPFLYNFSPSVVPPPLDWPEWIRVTGYWFLNDAEVGAKKWTPPPDLLPFIDSAHQAGKKVVYIGFGSIVVSDPKAMTRCVIEAVLQSGVYAILSKGWSDRLHTKTSDATEPEEPFPEQIYPISSIPHDWLFQRIDAACHHGGAGTTGATLRAGIPLIIKPFFGDQFFWADRVEALGIGTGVRKLTVDSLAEALVSATTDIKQIDRAKLVGEQIRSENGVATAIEAIYRDLDYARSLTKRVAHNAAVSPETEPTLRDEHPITSSHSTLDRSASRSRYSSAGSHRRAPSEDWSVISDQEDRRSSFGSRRSDGKVDRSSTLKRSSLAAAVMSVLPDALTSPNHRRSLSSSSQQQP